MKFHPEGEPFICAMRTESIASNALELDKSVWSVWLRTSIYLPKSQFPNLYERWNACSTAFTSCSESCPARNPLEGCLGSSRNLLDSQVPSILLLPPSLLPPVLSLMSGMNTAKIYALQMSWWFISNFPSYRTDLQELILYPNLM